MLLFAGLRETVGEKELDVELPGSWRCSAALQSSSARQKSGDCGGLKRPSRGGDLLPV